MSNVDFQFGKSGIGSLGPRAQSFSHVSSGLDIQVKVRKTFSVVPFSLGSGTPAAEPKMFLFFFFFCITLEPRIE